MRNTLTKLSVVIPCYRSESTISAVIDSIRAIFAQISISDYEIICVSDASPDNVYSVISNMSASDSRIIGIELARNFGQHGALMAGYTHASGDIIISMDDDGQTAADGIPLLINKLLADDLDVVFARYPQIRQSWFRRIGTKVNGWMMESLLRKPKGLASTSFFACRKWLLQEIVKTQSPYPYVHGYIFRCTNRMANVDISHHERLQGESGYSFSGLLRLWLNGFTSFSVKPLRVATFLGGIIAVLGFILVLAIIIQKLLDPETQMGWSSIMAAILFIGGVLMIMLGLIGEYLGRVFITINGSPQYIIRSDTRDNTSYGVGSNT
jgi:undecaprenyl-phosphate 4-deoxy-4-formamido-L-arabinose transferase